MKQCVKNIVKVTRFFLFQRVFWPIRRKIPNCQKLYLYQTLNENISFEGLRDFDCGRTLCTYKLNSRGLRNCIFAEGKLFFIAFRATDSDKFFIIFHKFSPKNKSPF